MSNLRMKLGNRVATEIFEYYESLIRRGEEKKLDNYETWATPIIKIWLGQSAMERNDCIVTWKAQDAMQLITRARERLVKSGCQLQIIGIRLETLMKRFRLWI